VIGMPALPWFLVHSTIYLYASKMDAYSGCANGASGFLLGVRSQAHRAPLQYWHLYAVTADHVIRSGFTSIRDSSKEVHEPTQWYSHPDGIDLALAPLGLRPQTFDSRKSPYRATLPVWIDEMFISRYNPIIKTIQTAAVGDDVFMLGRFSGVGDGPVNQPIARFGNIASPPIEMTHGNGIYRQSSFLVEMRSINQFSGSPVYTFVPDTDGLRGTLRERMRFEMNGEPIQGHHLTRRALLLGVDCGHTQDMVQGIIDDLQLARQLQVRVEVNTSLSVVTPAEEIETMLQAPELVARRQADDSKRTLELGADGVAAEPD